MQSAYLDGHIFVYTEHTLALVQVCNSYHATCVLLSDPHLPRWILNIIVGT